MNSITTNHSLMINITPTENGWTVTQYPEGQNLAAVYGKVWCFETIESLLKTLPSVLKKPLTDAERKIEQRWAEVTKP